MGTLNLFIKMCHINVKNVNLHLLKKLVYKDTLSLCIKMCHINVINANLHSLKKIVCKRHIEFVHKNVSYQCDECKSTFTQKIVYEDTLSLCIKMCHTNVTNANLHSQKE